MLETISALSHEFGTPHYAKGGGGNSSCKSDTTLWVKASGTTLANVTPKTLVALQRTKLARLYELATPQSAAAREALVKELVAAAVEPETPGRASVEAPLHDSLAARYVVHTHPPLVNALTCGHQGAAAAAELLPQALWVPYTDPGYTLSMHVRQAISEYRREWEREPPIILLENHGVFVAAETAAEVRTIYAELTECLQHACSAAGCGMNVAVGKSPSPELVTQWHETIRQALGTEGAAIAVLGSFDVADGPLTPDHIVYAKSYPFKGKLSVAELQRFRERHGYAPRVIVTDSAVLGVAANQRGAQLAVEMALDGAVIKQLATAFGGIRYLSDAAREFIENWEVESYRAQQV